MIDSIEIAQVARVSGVPTSTIERDYVQNWFLKALYSKDRGMIFKGGTAIRKAHIENYRFSDDLDFTLTQMMDEAKLKSIIEECVKSTRDEVNVNFEEDIGLEQNENGWVAKIYFRILRRTGSPLKIKLDISDSKNEIMLLPPEKRPVFHHFSDEYYAEVETYSLREIFSEKARALFQRLRPRDLYDVYYLWDVIDKKQIIDIFTRKCEFKSVTPSILNLNERKDKFRGAWERSLRHQLKNLPDFDAVFGEAAIMLEELGVE